MSNPNIGMPVLGPNEIPPIGYTGLKQLADGAIASYKNGILHNEDGPAIRHQSYDKYYLNGVLYSSISTYKSALHTLKTENKLGNLFEQVRTELDKFCKINGIYNPAAIRESMSKPLTHEQNVPLFPNTGSSVSSISLAGLLPKMDSLTGTLPDVEKNRWAKLAGLNNVPGPALDTTNNPQSNPFVATTTTIPAPAMPQNYPWARCFSIFNS